MTTSIRLRIYLNISTSENGENWWGEQRKILSWRYPKNPVKSRVSSQGATGKRPRFRVSPVMTTSIRLRITMLEKRSMLIVLHWWGICKHKMLEKWYKISCGFMLWNSPIKCCSIPPFRWKCGSEYRCGIYYWGLSNSSLFAKSAVSSCEERQVML